METFVSQHTSVDFDDLTIEYDGDYNSYIDGDICIMSFLALPATGEAWRVTVVYNPEDDQADYDLTDMDSDHGELVYETLSDEARDYIFAQARVIYARLAAEEA